MAEGLFIRVTNAASEGESVLLTDVFDATDGAAHELNRAGNVYVPTESSVDLAYTGDVARSFENGCIRGMINAGTLTATFGRGSAAGETIAIQVSSAATTKIVALGMPISATIATGGALNAVATIDVSDTTNGHSIVDEEDVGALNGVKALTLDADASDTDAGDVIELTLVSAAPATTTATIQLTFATADA